MALLKVVLPTVSQTTRGDQVGEHPYKGEASDAGRVMKCWRMPLKRWRTPLKRWGRRSRKCGSLFPSWQGQPSVSAFLVGSNSQSWGWGQGGGVGTSQVPPASLAQPPGHPHSMATTHPGLSLLPQPASLKKPPKSCISHWNSQSHQWQFCFILKKKKKT